MKSLRELRESLVVEHDLGGDHIPQMHSPGYSPPNILILKRKTVRSFSSTERVALYYSEKLGRYFSVPFTVGREMDTDHIVGVSEEALDEISIPTATRAFHARQELGDKAKNKKQYRAAIYHYAKAMKTLDRRAEKYKREDRGEVVEASGQWEVHRNGKFTTGQVETNYPVAKKHWDERTKKNEKGDKFTLVPRKPASPINEDAISHLQRVRAFKTSTALNHKDGSQTKVDPQTANALLTVHAAMHPDNKKKFADALEHSQPKFHKMLDFAWKQVK